MMEKIRIRQNTRSLSHKKKRNIRKQVLINLELDGLLQRECMLTNKTESQVLFEALEKFFCVNHKGYTNDN